MSSSYLLIGAIGLISYLAWNNGEIMYKSFFIPVNIKERNEYWRFITHGFIHADSQHLIFNLITFFFFGPYLEMEFFELFGNRWMFILFFFLALIMSSLPSYYKHKEDARYRSLGASGAISAVLFGAIVFNPWMKIYGFIPGFIFGAGYIWYSAKMSRENHDNIGHDAHLWGGVFGFLFPFVLKPEMINIFKETILNCPYFR
jgi:membrane associated rhomboid family serine protease